MFSGDAAASGDVAPLPAVSSSDEVEALASAERIVPAVNSHAGVPPERQVRYAWAASLVDGRSVLDAACGMGWGTAVLGDRAARAVGVDIAPPVVAAAQNDHGDRAEFRVGDLCRLPFGDGEFDVAVCFEAIERLTDQGAALAELRRVIAPQGLLLISAVNPAAYPAGNPFHLRELEPAELAASLERHFANVAVHRQHNYLASFLADDAAMAAGEASARVGADVAKLVATSAGDALYAVVAATDGELPPPPARVALGVGVDRGEQSRLLASWRERALAAELEVSALRNELEFVRRRGPDGDGQKR